MSNHRSVTKPKDVKYKRINKAKSKSLEELRGRLRNWVEKGNKIAISLDQSYAWAYYPIYMKIYKLLFYERKRVMPKIMILFVRLRNRLLSLVKSLLYLIEISSLHVIFTVIFCHVNYAPRSKINDSKLVIWFYYIQKARS